MSEVLSDPIFYGAPTYHSIPPIKTLNNNLKNILSRFYISIELVQTI